jgi:glutathionyl-hydroquinone reductase
MLEMTYQEFVNGGSKKFDEKVKEQREQEQIQKQESGIITMKYSEYKNNYAGCKTVPNSYDKKDKTIDVIVKNQNGICPKCHTYCYGDCEA